MTKILSLTKVLVLEQFKSVFGKIASGKKAKNLMLFLFVAVLILFSIGANYYSQFLRLQAQNMGHFILFHAILNVVIVLLILFTLQIQTSFFEAKDYEFLAKLPLKNYEIIASKLISQLINAYLISFFLLVPGLYFFFSSVSVSFLSILFLVVGFVFLPFFNFFIATLLSYAVNIIAKFFKNYKSMRKALSFVFMILLAVALFVITFLFIEDISATGVIPKVLTYAFPTATLYFNAVAFSSYISFFCFVGLNLLFMSLVFLMLSKTYFKVNKTSIIGKRKVVKKLDFKKKSVFKNLVKMEVKRFISIPIYIFNTSLGAIFMSLSVVAFPVVYFVFIKGTNIEMLFYHREFMLNLGFYIAILASINCTTYASVSIEGQMYSFKKSLPISFEKNMLAKLVLNIMLTIPTFLVLTMLMPFFILSKLYFYEILLFYILAIVAQAVIALSGLFSNLMFINVNWTSPNQPVKQSVPAFIYALVLVVFIVGIPFLMSYALKVFSMAGFIALTAFTLAILCVLLWWIVVTVGKKKYNKVG